MYIIIRVHSIHNGAENAKQQFFYIIDNSFK